MSTLQRFVPKPVAVEAARVPASNDFASAELWWAELAEVATQFGGTPIVSETDPNGIRLPYGPDGWPVFVGEGDWIVRAADGTLTFFDSVQFQAKFVAAAA